MPKQKPVDKELMQRLDDLESNVRVSNFLLRQRMAHLEAGHKQLDHDIEEIYEILFSDEEEEVEDDEAEKSWWWRKVWGN